VIAALLLSMIGPFAVEFPEIMTVKAPAGSRKRAQNNLEPGARKQNIQCAKSIFFSGNLTAFYSFFC